MQEEFWKPISGHNGYFEVSNLGRIRSITRTVQRIKRGVFNETMPMTIKGQLIKYWITKKGYCRCSLYDNGIKKNHLVHQLVAKAFLGESDKPQVNHKNCIKTDNKVENLEWVTNYENYLHAKENNLYAYQR